MAAGGKKKVFELTRFRSHDRKHATKSLTRLVMCSYCLHYLKKTLRPRDFYTLKLKYLTQSLINNCFFKLF
jgi:hypothetical protein